MVLDEDEQLKLDHEATIALLPDAGSNDIRNYGLVAELYQQLKKNYDDRKDYWTAGDFHYGEMEMKRLAIARASRHLAGKIPIPLRRWLHQRLGLVAWYKYASEYGESYVCPFVWLLVILTIFTLAYPIASLKKIGAAGEPPAPNAFAPFRGASHESPLTEQSPANETAAIDKSRHVGTNYLGKVSAPAQRAGHGKSAQETVLDLPQGAAPNVGVVREPPRRNSIREQTNRSAPIVLEVSYAKFFEFTRAHPKGEWIGAIAFFGHSLMTALYVSAFQKELVYEPSYPWGRLLTLLEVLLTSTLVALFLLAVRRQFRR